MNQIAIIDEANLKNRIYNIRGQEVMLDYELAEIYGYTTGAFNQQVERNKDRFDEDFYFQLTELEWSNLKSQNVISSYRGQSNLKSQNVISSWGGTRAVPHAFTEQGVYMLMTILKSKLAVEQSKALIRTFKKMKDYLLKMENSASWKDYSRLTEKVSNNTEQIEKLWNDQKELRAIIDSFSNGFQNKLLMDGKYVDADFVYRGIYASAKKSIIIIDNYVGLKTLVLLKDIHRGVKCQIISQNSGQKLHREELDDFYKQYPNVDIVFKTKNFKNHDRYIIIDYGTDEEKIYLCGGSSKDAGKKKTMIVELKNRREIDEILQKVI